ncbi:acyltransferase [Longirhabdus pacifica]|uniref:acyltransferase n=1 Tax=Longirhabdus pacifica TaxID=2305227 RepID=UPI0010092D08|nr:acyltransferase [Longirhabdus pacifica]
MNTSKQINEIYMSRAIGIIAVIIVHTLGSAVVYVDHQSLYYPLYIFLHTAFKFGTPTFILISSFVIFYNYYHRSIDRQLISHFYRKRLLYVTVPYVVISFFYFILKMDDLTSIWNLIQQFFIQLSLGTAHTHLYFVFISIQFYLMFPFILFLFKRHPFFSSISIIIGFVIQWIFVILYYYYNEQLSLFPVGKGSIALSYFSFYLTGAFLGIYYDKIIPFLKPTKAVMKKFFILYALLWSGTMFSIGGNIYLQYQLRANNTQYHAFIYELLWNMQTLLTAIVLFQISYLLKRVLNTKLTNLLMRLGEASFGIYLIHPFILAIYREFIMVNEYTANPLVYLFMFILALSLSWFIVEVTSKYFKFSWVIFGMLPKKRTNTENQQNNKSMYT